MATPAQNLTTAYESLAAKLAEVMADPKPSYSVDGVSLDWGAYYRMLTEQMKAVREALLLANGPFEVTSVAR